MDSNNIPEFLIRWLMPMSLTNDQWREVAARYQISVATLKLMVADARRRQEQ